MIAAIRGTAGVGKTALALHWAHRVAARFPGGQLYAKLHGYDPSGVPATTGETIRGFLHSLEPDHARIPLSVDEQAGLYRSLLAGKRMLVLLDNAIDAAQVRALLPGAPGCPVLVTSRSQLSGLVALNGGRVLNLDLLTSAEALSLLTSRLGTGRASAEPQAVEDLSRSYWTWSYEVPRSLRIDGTATLATVTSISSMNTAISITEVLSHVRRLTCTAGPAPRRPVPFAPFVDTVRLLRASRVASGV